MNARELFWSWLSESGIAADQFLNAFGLGFCAWLRAWWKDEPQSPAFADETLSAHAFRAWKRNKPWGRFWMPIIDWLFALWQKPDPTIVDAADKPIEGHCERAYMKEKLRRGMPPEYQPPPAQ